MTQGPIEAIDSELDGEVLLAEASITLVQASKATLRSSLEHFDEMSQDERFEAIQNMIESVDALREANIDEVAIVEDEEVQGFFEYNDAGEALMKIDAVKAALASRISILEQKELALQEELKILKGESSPVVTESRIAGMQAAVDIYDPSAALNQGVVGVGSGGYDAASPAITAAGDPYDPAFIASRQPLAAGVGGYEATAPLMASEPELARRRVLTEKSTNLQLGPDEVARINGLKARLVALGVVEAEVGVGEVIAAAEESAEVTAEPQTAEPQLPWREELEATLQDCAILSQSATQTRPMAERKSELALLRERFGHLAQGLKRERSEYFQRLSASYEALSASPDLRQAQAIVEEMNEALQYLQNMPSLSALEQNLSTLDGLMAEAGTLQSDNVYNRCFSSMVAGFAIAGSPFTEFVQRFDEAGKDVAVDIMPLTAEEIMQRDADAHDEVEAIRQNVQYAVYSKRLRDNLSSIPGYRKGESEAAYVERVDRGNADLEKDLEEFTALHAANQAQIGEFGFSSASIDAKYQEALDDIARLRVQAPQEFQQSLVAFDKRLQDKKAALGAAEARLGSLDKAIQQATRNVVVVERESQQTEQRLREMEAKLQQEVAALEETWQKDNKAAEDKLVALRDKLTEENTVLTDRKAKQGSFFGRVFYGIKKGFNFKALGNEIIALEEVIETDNLALKAEEDKKSGLRNSKEDAVKKLQEEFAQQKEALLTERSSAITVAQKVEELTRLQKRHDELEAEIEDLRWDVQYLDNGARIIGGKLKVVKEAEDILAKKAQVPEIVAASAFVVDPQEAQELALIGEVSASNSELAAREDMSQVTQRYESLEQKKESFQNTLKAMLVAAAERAHAVEGGDEEMKKNLKRRALALGAAVGKTIGGPVGVAVGIGSKVLDGLFATWQATENHQVVEMLDAMGDDLDVALEHVVSEVTKKFANGNSPDAALNMIQEATATALASEIAADLIRAIGEEKVDIANRRPSPSSFEIGADGVRRVKEGTPFSGFLDDLVSQSLARASFEKLKLAKKVVIGRATTEESVRGNLTGAGAKNGVGIEFVDESGEVVRLLPAGRESAKYGFREATAQERETYRVCHALKGYNPFVTLEERFDREFENLVRITRPANIRDGRSEQEVEDALSRMVMFYADYRQFVSAGKSATTALKNFAATLTPPEHRMVLNDEAVTSIEKLANLYNESTNTKTRKGVFFAGYKVDLTHGVAVGLKKSLESNKFAEMTEYDESFFEGDGPAVSDVFRGRVLAPQESLLGQLKVFVERQLQNPDCNFFAPTSKTSTEILTDLMTIVQRNSAAFAGNDSLLEEKLRATGLFNLDSPINMAKFKAVKVLATDLAKLHNEYLRDHTEEEAAAYYHFDSSQTQYDERMENLSQAVAGIVTATATAPAATGTTAPMPPEQKEELARIVGVYYETMEGGKKRHGDRDLKAVYTREMEQFYTKFSITPPVGEAALTVETEFRKAVDAHSLVQGRNTAMLSLGNKFSGAVKEGVATLKSGARVEKALGAAATAVKERFVGKSLEKMSAELQPSTSQAEAITALNAFVKDHLLRSPANSLCSGAVAFGSLEERRQDTTNRLLKVAQLYAESLQARTELHTPESRTKALAAATSADGIKTFLSNNEEFKSMISLNNGGKVLESERRKLTGIFSNLVKLHLKAEKEVGYVVAGPTLAGAEFDSHMAGLATGLGISDDQDRAQLVDAVQDYVLATQKGGDGRKYKHMLFDRLRGLNSALVFDAADLDYSSPTITHPVVSSCIRACMACDHMSKVDYNNVARLEEKMEHAIAGDLGLKPPHTADNIAEAICQKAASEEFANAGLKARKAMLSEMIDKGGVERSIASLGKAVGWSAERLKFDAVFDAMVHLSEGYKQQRAAGVAVVPGAHLNDISTGVTAGTGVAVTASPPRSRAASEDAISVSRASVSSVSVASAPSDDIEQMQKDLKARAGSVQFKPGKTEADLSAKISEAITRACAIVEGKTAAEREVALATLRDGNKAGFKVVMDIGSAKKGLFSRERTSSGERDTYDYIMDMVGRIAVACVEKGRRFETLDKPVPPAPNVASADSVQVETGRKIVRPTGPVTRASQVRAAESAPSSPTISV